MNLIETAVRCQYGTIMLFLLLILEAILRGFCSLSTWGSNAKTIFHPLSFMSETPYFPTLGFAYSPKTYRTEASTSRILLGESIPTGFSGKRLGSRERT
jgi:hypothetical protein